MFTFEGFYISIKEARRSLTASICGEHTQSRVYGDDYSSIIRVAKLKCLSILAAEEMKAVFICDKDQGNILFTNLPFQQFKDGLEINDKILHEGRSQYRGTSNKKPVIVDVLTIDYGQFLVCRVESIQFHLATVLPTESCSDRPVWAEPRPIAKRESAMSINT